MYLIYKITNPETGLSYIGQTLSSRFNVRLSEHRKRLTVESKDFECEIILENIPSRAESREMEKVYIDIFGTFENGYNDTRGGDGLDKHSDASKRKVSESLTGKVRSEESRLKQSKSAKGIPKPKGFGAKVSEAQTGRKRSKETRRKLSEKARGRTPWNKGKRGAQKAWNTGVSHPKRTRRRISERLLGMDPLELHILISLFVRAGYSGRRISKILGFSEPTIAKYRKYHENFGSDC